MKDDSNTCDNSVPDFSSSQQPSLDAAKEDSAQEQGPANTTAPQQAPTPPLSSPAPLRISATQQPASPSLPLRPALSGRARLRAVPWAMTVHGALHLLGYDHQGEEDAAIMEALESDILRGLGFACPYLSEPGQERAAG